MKKFTVSLFGIIAFMLVVNIGIASAGVMTGWVLNHANEVDVDNDKVITIDELMGHGRDAVIILDTNKDGKLGQEELFVGKTLEEKRMYANALGLQPGWILAHADRLDANEDGIITRLELIVEAVDAIRWLDKNQDSKLTGDECPKLATGEASISK